MATRTISGVLRKPVTNVLWGGAVVTFRLTRPFAIAGASYPTQALEVTSDETTAEIEVVLAVPDSGSARYECVLPDKRNFVFFLEAGAAVVNFEDLVAGAYAAGDAGEGLQAIIDNIIEEANAYTDTHAEVIASAGVLGHVRIGSGLTIDGDGVLSADGGAGVAAFLDLTDTPASYAGQSGRHVRVNFAADGLDFVAAGDTGFLIAGNNLSDVGNPATALTNIGAAAASALTSHTGNTSNPHSVTAAQTGALTQAVADTLYEPLGGGGATTFTGLTDTPANYTGHALKALRVNAGETAVEFVALGTLATQSGTFSGGGTLATGGFTLTVPATGTAALLGETQTFTGDKTFTGGLASPGAGGNSTKLGLNASAAGLRATAIGESASAGHAQAIALGQEAATTAANQLVIGSAGCDIRSVFIGKGVTAASPSGLVMQPSRGSGTNVAGATFTLSGGTGTGTGAGGSLLLATAPIGGSGASVNALVTAAEIDDQPTGGDETRLLLLDLSDGTLKRVTFGVDDSGGAGHKVLRVAN